jgi:TolB-like protein/Tfp pilus assembly protein PilF
MSPGSEARVPEGREPRLSPPIRFGVFEVDRQSGELRRRGARITLQEQPFQLLLLLLEHPREIVTREDIHQRLWPAGTFVDFERGLNRAMSRLRDALSDTAASPRFIETLPRRGYRFIAPLDTDSGERGRERDDVQGAPRTTPVIRSLAVLPLQNLSGSPDEEYFVDGMTDELITVLARIQALRVISRTSSMQYKGVTTSLPAIARELDVDAVLEGTVVRSGSRVRITVHLIHARDDRHLWAEEYERELTDVLALQGEVARAIARCIHVRLTPPERTLLGRSRPVDPIAYEAYLEGTFFRNQWTEDALNKSIDCFSRAVDRDPDSASSHAGLAHAYCAIGILGTRPSAEVYPRARASALTAVALDDTVAEAHYSLADVLKGYDWDWSTAEIEYRRALALDPSSAIAHVWYADYLSKQGRHADAIGHASRARALDPLSVDRYSFLGLTLYRARRYDDALGVCQKAADLDPAYPVGHWFLGLVHAQRQEPYPAIAAFEKASRLSGGGTPYRALLVSAYAMAGERVKAQEIREELEARARRSYVSPVDLAVASTGLADRDAAFGWLEKAFRERTMRIQELPEPIFDSLRCDTRFDNLLSRIGVVAPR